MTDTPFPQQPAPGPQPWSGVGEEPTLPYGIPSLPNTPAYDVLPPDHPSEPNNSYGAPAQYGASPGPSGSPMDPYGPAPSENGPGPYAGPPTTYGGPPTMYAGPPTTYGGPPTTYGGPPASYGGPPPGYGAPGGYPPPPPRRSRTPWLLAGATALVVALIGGAAVIVLTGRDSGENEAAGSPVPTGSYTDGLTSTEPSPASTKVPRTAPVPSVKPTPAERRRTLKDVDRGLAVYDDVYVTLAKGWRKYHTTKHSVSLEAPGRGAIVAVEPFGYIAATGVPKMVDIMVRADHMVGVKKEPVRRMRPANSNISSQAQQSYSGLVRKDGLSVSLVGRCTTMTGVDSIHNVTVTLCVVALKADSGPAFRDATAMLASIARSI